MQQIIYRLAADIHQFGDLGMIEVLVKFEVNDFLLAFGEFVERTAQRGGLFIGDLLFDDEIFDRKFQEKIILVTVQRHTVGAGLDLVQRFEHLVLDSS